MIGRLKTQVDRNQRAESHAARYDSGQRDVKMRTLRGFLRDISGRDVLDAGCGTGDVSSMCSAQSANVAAIDMYEPMLRKARDRYDNEFSLIRGSVESLPFKQSSFDVVLSMDVIEHLLDPNAFLIETRRVLRPGGHLVVATDNTANFWVLVKWLKRSRGRRDRSENPPRSYRQHFPVPTLKRMAAEAGLTLTRFDTYPDVASVPAVGKVLETVGRGPLRRFKWAHALYEFTKQGV
jgi:2-polyprenyl-3-methyl-5-hydroxy-6-metoxy-1,4-benzoquinol methylase